MACYFERRKFGLGEHALVDAGPWLDTRVLGHRLIQGIAEGIAGAQAAFTLLTNSPSEYELLARGALTQLKASPVAGETQAIALRLAVVTRNAEAALDVLRQSQAFDPACASLVQPLRHMAERLWRTGNPKSMRIGSGLAFELARLQADPNLGWGAIVARVQSEKDDLSMAQLVRALCLMARRDLAGTQTHMRWLLDFAIGWRPNAPQRVSGAPPDIPAAYESAIILHAFAPTNPPALAELV